MTEKQMGVCPRHQSLGNLNSVCFIQPATALFAVFQDASRLHTLKLRQGTMTQAGSRMPQGSLEAEQRQLWINEHNGHKLIPSEWRAEESKVILNGISNKAWVDRAEFRLACRNVESEAVLSLTAVTFHFSSEVNLNQFIFQSATDH